MYEVGGAVLVPSKGFATGSSGLGVWVLLNVKHCIWV